MERTGISVGVGQDVRADLTLQPGEQTQTITVTGEAPQINVSNAQLGGTLENQPLNELPLNGRQYTHLIDSRPGVMAKPGAAGNAFLSNGSHSEENVWMFDGLVDFNVNNGASGVIGGNNGGGGGTDQLTILPIDAIQEVNLIENPKAEYGWKTGVQVNVGLKSGTNTIHGTAFGFGRDSALDAKNPYLTPAQAKAALDLEQFGGSIGGPIKKDKLFYFGTYERQHYLVGNPKFVQLPTAAPGAGTNTSFPDAITDILTKHPTVKLSQLALNLAGCTVNGTTASCNAANGVFGNSTGSASDPIALSTFGTSNNYLGKIDYHINDHHSLNGEFFYGAGAFLNASSVTQQYWETEQYNSHARVARAVWAWTPNPTWLNEARFGLDNYNAPVTVAECTLNVGQPNYAQQFGLVTGLTSNPPSGCGFPVLTISGFAALGGQNQVTLNHFNTFEGSDSVSYTRGKHLFKFGGEIRRTLWDGGTWNNARGNITFGTTAAFTGATALEDFLAGTASSAQLLLGNPGRSLALGGYAAFAQDDWRITSRLTLNLGLRYEYEPPVRDRNNLFGNFDASAPTGLVQQTGGNSIYNSDFNNVAPRLGLAWDITGKGTTVLRAGAGIVYSTPVILMFTSTPQGARLRPFLPDLRWCSPTARRSLAREPSMLASFHSRAPSFRLMRTCPSFHPARRWPAATARMAIRPHARCRPWIRTSAWVISPPGRSAFSTPSPMTFPWMWLTWVHTEAICPVWSISINPFRAPRTAPACDGLQRTIPAALQCACSLFRPDHLSEKLPGVKLQCSAGTSPSRSAFRTGCRSLPGYTYAHNLDINSADELRHRPRGDEQFEPVFGLRRGQLGRATSRFHGHHVRFPRKEIARADSGRLADQHAVQLDERLPLERHRQR